MKIAIPSMGKNLDAQIDPCFGQCAYFLIVEAEDMSFEVVDNEIRASGDGARIKAIQVVASKGANVIITRDVGPNAASTLSAAGLQIITRQTGTVRKAVEDYKMRRLIGSNKGDTFGKSGMMIRGAGMGRGGGIGQGAGC